MTTNPVDRPKEAPRTPRSPPGGSAWERACFRHCVAAAALCALTIVQSQVAAASPPANTLRELFTQLNRCLAAPTGNIGSELTIVFSLRRDGSLLGKPKITFAKLPGDVSDQRKFADGVVAAFDKCLPVAISEGLGGAIAGRPLSMRFVIRARETDT
jgi:hypothetical protein